MEESGPFLRRFHKEMTLCILNVPESSTNFCVTQFQEYVCCGLRDASCLNTSMLHTCTHRLMHLFMQRCVCAGGWWEARGTILSLPPALISHKCLSHIVCFLPLPLGLRLCYLIPVNHRSHFDLGPELEPHPLSWAIVGPLPLDLHFRSGLRALAVAVKASPETTGILIFYQPEHIVNFPAQWQLRIQMNTKIKEGLWRL